MNAAIILIIEDEPAIRDALAELLSEHGYKVVTAEDGREAWWYLHTHPQPDLIITDLMMPIMNGQEFMALLRTEPALADIPMIVISASSDLHQGPLAPGVIRLSKPIVIPTLLATVKDRCSDHAD